MMTNVVARAWQTVRPHVPLIKFRKGSAAGHSGAAKVVAAAGAPKGSGQNKLKPVQAGPLIEDWQLPYRYRRQPLSQAEVDYINRGGPE